ncbi:MAG: hypothetical protein HY526_02640 [Betaproteobacteria bacterium]|nr:hypothetical protein [Betaproteobacteria bacterium]
MNSQRFHVAWIALIAALGGCTIMPPVPRAPVTVDVPDGDSRRCAGVLHDLDQAVARAGVADAMAARVTGFPHLRASRFLASYAGDTLHEAQFAEWIRRMGTLGADGYAVEIANLPAAEMERLEIRRAIADGRHADAARAVSECVRRLAAADLASPGRRLLLREAVHVRDEYLDWQRVVGIYWLTRIPFAHGIGRWQESVRQTFGRAPEALPVAGVLRRYAPPPVTLSHAEAAAILARSSHNALGIPDPTGADRDRLFAAYAPVFEIDTSGPADRPGALAWRGGDAPEVDTARVAVYRRISHTRYRGRVLLQLNYALWFPERPRDSGWDILGGHLDGLVWRVTLAPDGAPWVFDSIHHCGCYHQFFPTARAVPRAAPATLDESAFVPQRAPDLAENMRIILRVAPGTHYLQAVMTDDRKDSRSVEYALREDDALRSLPLPQGGSRSAFGPDGIVAGTERDERYWFWPMGVPEPGAMRQWGRHATAFVGRRHFDDADLFEKYFELTPP